MKRIGAIGTASLFLIVGAAAFGFAQGRQSDNNQGNRNDRGDYGRDNGQQQGRRPQANRPSQQQRRPQARAQQQRTVRQQRAQEVQQRRVWEQRRARTWENEHRTWRQRGGYRGHRISNDYFQTYYGSNNHFRVYGLPFIQVGGNPRFQYNGYWFSTVDPYPEYWGPNWYQTDDVYVDYYNDGYYLYNSRYPGRSGIAISISF